jgi:hypothetical protein
MPPSDPAAAARSGHRPDHTTAAPIKPQLRRSATAGAAFHNIDHNDVTVV